MPSPRPLATAFFLLAGGMSAWALPACGSSDAQNPDFGAPPDPSVFNPGAGGSDGYGYGSGAETPFVCPDALKRCSSTFTFPDSGESSVELRGDFGGPETWQQGKAMAKAANVVAQVQFACGAVAGEDTFLATRSSISGDNRNP